MAAEDASIKHVNDGARGVEWRLDQRAGAAETEIAIAASRRMNEEGRAAPIELGPNRLEARIAKIDAVEIAEHREPLGAELLLRAVDLANGARRIAQRRHRHQAEPRRMGSDQRRPVSIGSDDRLGSGDRVAICDQLRPATG